MIFIFQSVFFNCVKSVYTFNAINANFAIRCLNGARITLHSVLRSGNSRFFISTIYNIYNVFSKNTCPGTIILYFLAGYGIRTPPSEAPSVFQTYKIDAGARKSTSNLTVLIKTGLLLLNKIIPSRQLCFFKRLGETLHPRPSHS